MTTTCRTIEDALRLCVDALGGPQIIGHRLRPEMNPIAAGIWLAHCLNEHHAQKPSLAQVLWIFREAKAAGEHAGAGVLNELIGYRVEAVVDEREQLADLARQARAAADKANELSTEVLERMRHSNLKVDG